MEYNIDGAAEGGLGHDVAQIPLVDTNFYNLDLIISHSRVGRGKRS